MKIENLIGKRFGRLVVLYPKERKPCEKAYWICQCDCGKTTIVNDYKLKTGHTKSCGCLKYRQNRYEICGDITYGYTSKGVQFVFDTEDLPKIKDFYWNTNCGYITTDKGFTKLHRVIMDCPNDLVVDHINHDRKDNRKQNLRICKQSENIKNQKLRNNNTSGCAGVRRYNYNGRDCFIAQISVNGKKKTLGYYDTIDEAIQSRKEAEKVFYRDFACN